MGTIVIKQIRSAIGKPKKVKDTLKALGLKKINHSVEKNVNPQIEGMVARVSHMIEVTNS